MVVTASVVIRCVCRILLNRKSNQVSEADNDNGRQLGFPLFTRDPNTRHGKIMTVPCNVQMYKDTRKYTTPRLRQFAYEIEATFTRRLREVAQKGHIRFLEMLIRPGLRKLEAFAPRG